LPLPSPVVPETQTLGVDQLRYPPILRCVFGQPIDVGSEALR
jgi:hypothetical protein